MRDSAQSYRYSSSSAGSGSNDQRSRRESNQSSYHSGSARNTHNNFQNKNTHVANDDQRSRRESNQSSHQSGGGASDRNSYQNNFHHVENVGIYAQPYHNRSSHVSNQSDYQKTSKSATAIAYRESLDPYQPPSVSATPTIALFGVGSKTSLHFLRHALNAGYHVRAMIIHQSLPMSSSQADHRENDLYPRDVQVHALAKELREEFAPQESTGTLRWIRADYIYDTNAIRRTIRNTRYVVCMMQDHAPISSYGTTIFDDDNANKKRQQHYLQPTMILPMDPSICADRLQPITSFMQVLYPLMKTETSIKVFLYQASSVASDVKGKTPIFSKALKTLSAARNFLPGSRKHATTNFTNTSLHIDHNSVIKEIARHHRRRRSGNGNRLSLGDISNTGSSYSNSSPRNTVNDHYQKERNVMFDVKDESGNQENMGKNHSFANFAYIITRPTTFLKDGRSVKKVSASKSQPGPFPIAHADLAEFSLTALLNQKLYNSSPYVVTDSF